jgi:hypothetical protein
MHLMQIPGNCFEVGPKTKTDATRRSPPLYPTPGAVIFKLRCVFDKCTQRRNTTNRSVEAFNQLRGNARGISAPYSQRASQHAR